MESKITIDGMNYHPIKTTTLQNDYFVMAQLNKSGIANITPNPGESSQDYAMRLVAALVANGVPLLLLGGLILPEGIPDKDWTPEQAETTAALLGQVTAQQDKDRVQALIISVVSDFFRQGLRYLNASPAVLQAASEAQQAQPRPAPSSAPEPAQNS